MLTLKQNIVIVTIPTHVCTSLATAMLAAHGQSDVRVMPFHRNLN